MATIAEMQAQLDSLKKLKFSGVSQAKNADNATTLRDLPDLDKLITDLERAIAAAQGTVRGRIRYAYQRCKGL